MSVVTAAMVGKVAQVPAMLATVGAVAPQPRPLPAADQRAAVMVELVERQRVERPETGVLAEPHL